MKASRFSLAFVLLLSVPVFTTGCNFFGKQVENTVLTAPGELPDGHSIVGSWSISQSSINASKTNPDQAFTTTFTFDPNGSARIESRNHKSGGVTCTGFGQYRSVGTTGFVIYTQSATPADSCAFPAQISMSRVSVSGGFLSYYDSNESEYRLYASRAQTAAPLGVWDFGGVDGLDYIFFDQHGYFLMQVASNGSAYMVEGYYTLSNGGMTLHYISGGDPSHVAGVEVFSGYVTNGTLLQLDQSTTQGDFSYVGTKR